MSQDQAQNADGARTAHDFTFTSIKGEPLPLRDFAGKTVLIVNTASQCSFMDQYRALQALWDEYKDDGLVVLSVPSNDFGHQEPGSDEEIEAFHRGEHGFNFPMTSKTHVSGDEAHPFFDWAAKQYSVVAKPRWNFHKYLIDPEGRLVDWFSTVTQPDAKHVVKAIKSHLPKATSGEDA